jgi:acyl-CoA synthetase (AMP-forming)/AMP-acid ligase II
MAADPISGVRSVSLSANPSIPTLVDQVRQHASNRHDGVAVHFNGKSISFREVDERASKVARGLLARQVGRHTRIAVLSKNTPMFYDLLLGTAKVGAVLVPINYRLAPPEIAFILNDSTAEMLFVASEFLPAIEQIRTGLKSIRQVIVIGEFDKDSDEYTIWRNMQSSADPLLAVDSEAVTVQMYTSGTTGHPKGALLTHINLAESLRGSIPVWGPWCDRDVMLVCMPQYHIGASIWGMAGLSLGIESVLTADFDVKRVLQVIEQHRITKTQLASVMMRMLLDDPTCGATDFSSLDLIIYGAAPAPVDLVRRAQRDFGCGIAQGYGMTESAGMITYLSPVDHATGDGKRLTSAGKAIDGVEIMIVGAQDKVLASGKLGEIVCRGRQIVQGYWNLPEASSQAVRSGWFHTGDAGYIDEEGYLFVRDRVKDMIVSGGENIYPAEIENVFHTHPDIVDVAVIGVPDIRWGESVKAIVVCRPGATVNEEELVAFVRPRIAAYKVPRSIEFVATLPRNASGKILKRELRKPYWTNRDSKVI